MSEQLTGRRVAILAADGVERVERVEVEQPCDALRSAGARTDLVSIKEGTSTINPAARDHDLAPAGEFTVDALVGSVSVGDDDALVLPGDDLPAFCAAVLDALADPN